jgi:hypothetical protein
MRKHKSLRPFTVVRAITLWQRAIVHAVDGANAYRAAKDIAPDRWVTFQESNDWEPIIVNTDEIVHAITPKGTT